MTNPLPEPPQESVRFTATQRLIFDLTRSVNERRALKRMSHAFLRSAGAAWVYHCTKRLLRVAGDDVLDRLPRDRGLVVAANHRSFFDMYVISSVLLRRCRWIERMYFPVRSDYFYDRLDGLLVNAIMSGLSMYPPIFRDVGRRPINRHAVAFVAEELRSWGTIVGLHPEGRRSTGADPYELLPAQPGIGEIVHRSNAVVLPVFILGLSNDLVGQVRGNFDGTGDSVTITFGEPLRFDRCADVAPRGRISMEIAKEIRAAIERLGAIDRERRQPRANHVSPEGPRA